MKKLSLLFLCILSLMLLIGCRSSQTDYDKITQRLYDHYGWIYPDEVGLVDAFLRGTYIDDDGKLVVRIGIEEDDEMFDKLVQEMKKVAWPSGKPIPEMKFVSSKVSETDALAQKEELSSLWEANKDTIFKDIRGYGPGKSNLHIDMIDLTKEKASAIRVVMSNPGVIDFDDVAISSRSFYINDKSQKIITRNSDYKKIIKNLEKYYGNIPEQFPRFMINGYEDLEYRGGYIDSEGILVILVGGRIDEYDANVERITKIAWPENDKEMPEVIFAINRIERKDVYKLHDEIWEQLRENYFDKKSIWSDVTAVYNGFSGMGLEVRNLTDKKKAQFRSLVSYPNALYFRETRTDLPPINVAG